MFGKDTVAGEVYERERVVLGVNAVRQWVTIQFRPSCNPTKNPEVIPGIFCIGMAEVDDLIFIHIVS